MRDVMFSTSRAVRVLDALHRWFAEHSIAPSYREIERAAGVPVQHVRSVLDELQGAGFLKHAPGTRRSVIMAHRLANVSDHEIEIECRARGWTVTRTATR